MLTANYRPLSVKDVVVAAAEHSISVAASTGFLTVLFFVSTMPARKTLRLESYQNNYEPRSVSDKHNNK